jgi:hypothetical protein
MNFSKALFILAATLCVQLDLAAQDPNRNEYYINLKGDTIFGKFVDFPEGDKSPEKPSFIPEGDSLPLVLSPASCRKFSAGNSGIYISYSGRRLANSTNYQFVRENSKDVYEQVSLFMKELFNDGHYRLYELADKNRTNFFAGSDSIPLKELYYRVLLEEGNVIPSPGFRQQLVDFFADSLLDRPGIRQALENLNYTEQGLVMFFTRITTGKRIKIRSKYPSQFILGVGASVNYCKVTGTYNPNQTDNIIGTYSTQTSPLFEAGVKLFSQRNLGRGFLMLRLNAYSFDNFKDFFTSRGEPYRSSFKGFIIGFPISVGYKLVNSSNLSLEFSAGASGLALVNSEEKQAYGPPSSPGFFTQVGNSGILSVSGFGELAFVWKGNCSLYSSYYSPASVANDMNATANHSSVEFGFRYTLF